MSILHYSSWKTKPLIFCHLLAIFLVSSVFYEPLYNVLWRSLDQNLFFLFHKMIDPSPFWQNFWGFANHRMADFLEDVFFVIFFLWLIKTTPVGQRKQKASEFLFLALLTTAVVLFVNNLLFKQIVHIKRDSPSLLFPEMPRLSEMVLWIKVKSASKICFPSDHSTTALMFILDFFLLTRNKPLLIAVGSYGIFLCCPRMAAGAHWMTDIVCGSFSVVLVIYSWFLFTPCAAFCIRNIHKIFSFRIALRRT